MMLVVSNCLSNAINYIWFINIILNIVHFLSKIVVLFYCFEEMRISNIKLDAPSCGLRREDKSPPPIAKIMPFK